jgi:hypothetical protein
VVLARAVGVSTVTLAVDADLVAKPLSHLAEVMLDPLPHQLVAQLAGEVLPSRR